MSEAVLDGRHPVPHDIDARTRVRELFSIYGPAYRWFVTFTAMLGAFATLLSGTIVNVAIPDVMGALGMTPEQAQWLSTGFLASTTVTMLLAAWSVERFGMSRTFNFSMLVFLGGSVLGGLAGTGEVLILSRVIQGAGSGLMTPVSMLIIFQVFPLQRRGTAMGIYSVGVVLAPALGPVLGGWLIDTLSWRYVFLVAVPFALISIPLAMVFMPHREPDATAPRFDWSGVILLSLFLVTLMSALAEGPKDDFGGDDVAVLLFCAAASGMAFVAWELHVRDPMIDLSLFANGRFAAAAIVTLVIGAGLFGSTYLLPLFMQIVQDYKPTDAGMLMVPAGLMMALFFPIAGRLSDQMSARRLIMFGVILFAISSLLMSQVDLRTPFLTLALWALMGRIGLSFIFPCLNAAALRPLPLHQLAQGSGIVNFLRQLGGAFGVNALAIFLERRTAFHVGALAPQVSQASPDLGEWFRQLQPTLIEGNLVDHLDLPFEPFALQMLARSVYLQGSVLGYRDAFLVIGVGFVLCMIPVWFMDSRAPDPTLGRGAVKAED
ncbi:MAG TPA: DHA2 family efflux MFS transporter permease subunit [Pseudomonadales bacterium]|nr:DHA2 family efflux MFS transporter permease subunit [Pseudomonadales bacterium]